MGTPLERKFKCTKCGEVIKISGEEPLGKVTQEIGITVRCPACERPNPVDNWIKGVTYEVTVEKKKSK
jgi:transcription elongation factor Elf1